MVPLMRRLLVIVAAFMLSSGLAVAGEWTGFLMDTMCAAKKIDQAATHTADCMKSCSKSGFGLVTKEGEYLKFNEAGNARALKALDASSKQDHLEVKVSGTLKSGVIQVDSIEML